MIKAAFNNSIIRQDFPILQEKIHGKPLIYLDNAATSQKPQSVIDALQHYYTHDNSNVHRAVHTLSERATHEYEATRKKIHAFINSKEEREIIFVRGTTEGINLIAQSYARPALKSGDEIIISEMEHHSNIVPWQMVAEQTGAILKIIPINENGELIYSEYENLLSTRTKIVSIVHMSNSLGTINPVKKIIAAAHAVGAVTIIDGAQAIAHLAVDVQDLDCDFYTFSGHKLFGPTGIGVLYGRGSILDKMQPYQGGGDMISEVTFKKTTYREIPYKYEAGTPNIAGVIGLGAAIDYFQQFKLAELQNYEHELLLYGTQKLKEIPKLRMIGTANEKAAILSFVLEDIHAHDVGTILDHEGIAVRTGHHCTMPIMEHFHVPATVRASLAFYNNKDEIDALIRGLHQVREVFK